MQKHLYVVCSSSVRSETGFSPPIQLSVNHMVADLKFADSRLGLGIKRTTSDKIMQHFGSIVVNPKFSLQFMEILVACGGESTDL